MACVEAAGKAALHRGAEMQICARKAAQVWGRNARKCLWGLGEKNFGKWEVGLKDVRLCARKAAQSARIGGWAKVIEA